MNSRIDRARDWLSRAALPLWLDRGVDSERGGFVEALSVDGEPLDHPRRAMVQARMIYCLRTAIALEIVDETRALAAIESGMTALLGAYSLPNGAFAHSADRAGRPVDSQPDLYAQAFALFGLAHYQAIRPEAANPDRAQKLLRYLRAERAAPGGGFTELGPLYESNPHMHLFEAALAWLEISPVPVWRELADELYVLCRERFIDRETGFMGEHFAEDWTPLRDAGRFVFEPGHVFEWVWLLGRFEILTGINTSALRVRLFSLGERHGLCADRRAAFDEVWSDGAPKARTARLWPQCERIKAALQLAGEATNPGARLRYVASADEAFDGLFKFLETPTPGLWFDLWEESGGFRAQPARASSLYHIIGALHEYLRDRPRFG